jgi:hypothetical protein
MADKHKSPLLGWHPPAGQAARVRAEADRRGVKLSVVLNEMLNDWLDRLDLADVPQRRAQ